MAGLWEAYVTGEIRGKAGFGVEGGGREDHLRRVHAVYTWAAEAEVMCLTIVSS
jgi:hypothetical protein